jgi:hypothetical protein
MIMGKRYSLSACKVVVRPAGAATEIWLVAWCDNNLSRLAAVLKN